MRVAIFGGTPVDAQMGCRLFESLPIQTIPVAISASPKQQTQFQTSDFITKNTLIRQKIEYVKQSGCQIIVIYCNSLSASIDFSQFEKDYQIPILTPFLAYAHYAMQFKNVGVLTANAQGAAGIERELVQKNSALRISNITNLAWVAAVEEQIAPEIIATSFGLPESLRFFEAQQVEAIIIGCTHFPYFLPDYQRQTTIPCVNPDDTLYTALQHFTEVEK